MPKKLTREIFIEKAEKIHNGLYDYSLVEYVSAHVKIKIICNKSGHGEFEQSPSNHLSGQHCPKCMGFNKTTVEFIQESKKIHSDLYDYSFVNYINATIKVKIICKDHGEFTQKPIFHLRGHGCPKCAGNMKSSTKEFIKKAKIIHGDKYDYSLAIYTNAISKVKIKCKKEGHGIFEQTPYAHLNGQGCPKCGGTIQFSVEDFIRNAIKIHGNKYGYSLVDYNNAHAKVKIICKDHGEFEQEPNSHLCGNGCPKCTSKISLPEIIWLNINHIKPEFRQYKILKYKVDGYDPETNTVYEFHGDYWHGNPDKFKSSDINKVAHKTFGELYEKTIQREQEFMDSGYNLITIWESGFKKQYKEQIENYKSLYGTQKITECNCYK